MNRADRRNSPATRPSIGRSGKKRLASIALVILVALYGVLQPRLNERFGLNLPGLPAGDQTPAPSTLAERVDVLPDADANGVTYADTEQSGVNSSSEQSEDLLYGILREVGPDRFVSPEGLYYISGSAEGHRLEHLKRHTADQPSRPGKHGVFDGGMEGALITIDRAYDRARQNRRTTKQVDRQRTVYTIEMDKRVGYVGGSEGKRLRHPVADRVKLVLEGKNVITAYPL